MRPVINTRADSGLGVCLTFKPDYLSNFICRAAFFARQLSPEAVYMEQIPEKTCKPVEWDENRKQGKLWLLAGKQIVQEDLVTNAPDARDFHGG